MTRGIVLPLTDAEKLYRARYLAQLVDSSGLDRYVRNPALWCPDLFYLLKRYNGGKDPTAPDPADRWRKDGSTFENRTCDCSGGDAWIHGHDRYQEDRMADDVGYEGWFNTDSKILDARRVIVPGSVPRCFEAEDRPFVGAIIVCKSGSSGHRIGHEETIIEVPAEWDATERDCWKAIKTSGIRGSGSKANGVSTGVGWFMTGAMFLRCLMKP